MSIVGTYPAGIKPKGFQQLTVSTTAVGLTVPAGATRAVCHVQSQPLRWRDDGTNPTSSVGVLTAAAVIFELHGTYSMNAFKAIRSGSTDSVLEISYYG